MSKRSTVPPFTEPWRSVWILGYPKEITLCRDTQFRMGPHFRHFTCLCGNKHKVKDLRNICTCCFTRTRGSLSYFCWVYTGKVEEGTITTNAESWLRTSTEEFGSNRPPFKWLFPLHPILQTMVLSLIIIFLARMRGRWESMFCFIFFGGIWTGWQCF